MILCCEQNSITVGKLVKSLSGGQTNVITVAKYSNHSPVTEIYNKLIKLNEIWSPGYPIVPHPALQGADHFLREPSPLAWHLVTVLVWSDAGHMQEISTLWAPLHKHSEYSELN